MMDVIVVDSWTQESVGGQRTGKAGSKPSTAPQSTDICRLCGELCENCISIFENKLSIAEKISRCLPIMVLANDDLPSYVCKRCLAYLNISYKLIMTSIKTDKFLRNILDESKPKKKEAKRKEPVKKPQTTLIPKEEVTAVSIKKLRRMAIHGPVNCEFCSLTFEDVYEFDEHFESNHILKWKCNFCDGSFQTSDELITHKAMLHAGNIIICKSCVDEETAMIQKKLKHEVDSFSSGEEHEEKFYIPAEPMSPKPSESGLNPPATPNLPPVIKSAPKSPTQISCDQSFDTPTTSNSKNMLPASLLVSSELTSKFLSSSSNVTPQLVFSSTLDVPQFAFASVDCSTPVNNSVPLTPSPGAPNAESSFLARNTSVDKLIKPVKFAVNEKNEEIKAEDKTKNYMTCDVCHLRVDDKKLFDLHQKIHRLKTMVCVLCKFESPTIYDLYLHKRQAHNLYSKVNLKYVCEKCGRFFSNSWQWESHKSRRCRNREGNNKCKYCEASFSTNHKLKRHLRKHKEELMNDPEVEPFRCVSCPKIFYDEEFYQKHRNVHDPECWNNFKCNACDRSFRDAVRLREHMRSIHEGIKPHVCDMCGKGFHRQSNMKVHRMLHFGHKCTHCEEVFEKVRQLVNHIQEVHGVEPPASLIAKKGYVSGTYICRFCGRTLATYQSLLDHEHIHTGEKPYSCHICDKSFRSYTARWSHVQRHEKGTFICEQCGKSFSFKQNLMTHVQIHVSMEDRKHQCHVCEKKFLRKAHLNVHMRIHDGIRPYTCDICNFSFTQIGDMRRHRARHENGTEMRRRTQRPKVAVKTVKWVSESSNEETN